MDIIKKYTFILIFSFSFISSSFSQCLLNFEKINIFADVNIGTVAATDL